MEGMARLNSVEKLSRNAKNLSLEGMARPNSVEKTYVGGSKTTKFVNVFSLESFVLYSTSLTTTVLLPMALRSYGTSHSETDRNKKCSTNYHHAAKNNLC